MVTFVKDPSPQSGNVDGSTVGTDFSNEYMDRLGLARPTASRAIVTDSSGFYVVSATTSTEVGYLSGVTSAIQTQLNAKQATLSDAANIVYTDATATMTAAHTYTTGLLKVADLVDANGKVSLAIAATASAVDGLTITNAATANPAYVGLSATGTDTNIGIKLVPKGTGKIRITDGTDTTKILALDISGATAAKTMTFAISHTNDRTITFPDSTATLATTAQLTDGSTITGLVNAQVASGAAIALSKLATVTASKALVSDSGGLITSSSVTSTELGYVSGVTSAIQTQIDSKQATLSDAAHIVYTDATATHTAAKTFTTGLLKVADLVDANGNVSLAIAATASAVDGLTITNAATASPAYVGFSATGTDSNVGIKISPKGTGKIRITDGTDTAKILAIDVSGATTAKTMTLAISHTNDRTITFPDSTATLATTAQLTDGSTITGLVNAQVASGAAIALSKLATVTASRALASDSGGLITASSVTSTELGYVSGVTSAIQTQFGNTAKTNANNTFGAFYNELTPIATPSTPSTGFARVYSKTRAGQTLLAYIDDWGFERILTQDEIILNNRRWHIGCGDALATVETELPVSRTNFQGANFTNVNDSTNGARKRFTTPAGGNFTGTITDSAITYFALNPRITIKMAANQNTTCRIMCMFAASDPTGTSTSTSIKRFGIIQASDAGNTNWCIQTCDGTTLTNTQMIAKDTSVHTFVLMADNANSKLWWSADGSAFASITATLPTSTQSLILYLGLKNTDGTTAVSMDFWGLEGRDST